MIECNTENGFFYSYGVYEHYLPPGSITVYTVYYVYVGGTIYTG